MKDCYHKNVRCVDLCVCVCVYLQTLALFFFKTKKAEGCAVKKNVGSQNISEPQNLRRLCCKEQKKKQTKAMK